MNSSYSLKNHENHISSQHISPKIIKKRNKKCVKISVFIHKFANYLCIPYRSNHPV